MPIPNSVLGSVLPNLSKLPAEVFPSVGTLRPMTKGRDSAGQTTHTFADSTDPALANLACRITPLILVGARDQERPRPEDERAEALLQLNFAVYINVALQTLLTWQVKVDGVVYQIRAVESDGNKQMTRLLIANTNQFEA